MNKRTDQKKQRNKEHMSMLAKLMAIVFCIAFMVFSINAADTSTRRMIMCNDDKYALAVSMQEDSMLRLDVAGEKFLVNVKPVVQLTEKIASGSRSCYESLVEAITRR